MAITHIGIIILSPLRHWHYTMVSQIGFAHILSSSSVLECIVLCRKKKTPTTRSPFSNFCKQYTILQHQKLAVFVGLCFFFFVLLISRFVIYLFALNGTFFLTLFSAQMKIYWFMAGEHWKQSAKNNWNGKFPTFAKKQKRRAFKRRPNGVVLCVRFLLWDFAKGSMVHRNKACNRNVWAGLCLSRYYLLLLIPKVHFLPT